MNERKRTLSGDSHRAARALVGLVALAVSAASPAAQGSGRIEPVFPAETPGFAWVEAEDAVSTNFAREATLDYSASRSRTLRLNREGDAPGAPFYAEYALLVEEAGTFRLYVAGTLPGPADELLPSYGSPLSVSVDGGAPRPLFRENVAVVEAYGVGGFWYAAEDRISLEPGMHTLRFEAAERRRHDRRWYLALDAFFLLADGSPVAAPDFDRSVLPERFPRDLADRSLDNPYLTLAQYSARIDADPSDRGAYLSLAQVYGMIGDHANALRTLARGKLAAGDDPRFTLLSARSRVWSGEGEEGLRLFREFLGVSGGDRAVWAEAAKIAAWLGRYEESLGLYRDAIARFPDDLNLRVNFGLTYLWAGRAAEGKASIDEARATAFASVEGVKELADIYAVNGYPAEALDSYRDGISRFPDELELYLLASRASMALGDGEGALRFEREAAARFVPSPRLEALLAARRRAAELKDLALGAYAERLEANPDDLALREELVAAYFWNGRLEEAAAEALSILVNRQYLLVGEFERELMETWRLLDELAVHRSGYPRAAAGADSGADRLAAALAAWEKAEAEAARLEAGKDAAKAAAAAEYLAKAGTDLAHALLEASYARDRLADLSARYVRALDAADTEAARAAADADLLGGFGTWAWRREADLAELASRAASGESLAAALLDRVSLVERKPAEVSACAERAARSAEPAAVLPLGARARIQARIWLEGAYGSETGGADAETYFAYATALAGLSFEYGAEASPASGAFFMPGSTPDEARAALVALREAARGATALGARATRAVEALHRRARARFLVYMYRFDSETVADRRELADVYLALDRPRDAVVQLSRALAVAPWDSGATFALARAHELSGDWSKAMELYRRVDEIDPALSSAAVSYNRLAGAHADRIEFRAGTDIDSTRTTARARIDYVANLEGMLAFVGSYSIDALRVHSAFGGSDPAVAGLQSIEAGLRFSLERLGLRLDLAAGGTLDNRLWGEESFLFRAFEPEDLLLAHLVAPKASAGLAWTGGPFSVNAGYAFDQLPETFLPGRDAWYEHAFELTLSAYKEFTGAGPFVAAGFRGYGKLAKLFAPVAGGANLLVTALGEGSATFRLLRSPWTVASLGGHVVYEDSSDPAATDYYAPDRALVARAGPQLSSWIGVGSNRVLGLSARLWAGARMDASSILPSFDATLRAELSKGGHAVYGEAAGSWTGDAAGVAYWSLTARIGTAVSLPDFILP
ncbi:MAG TPA: hypothetical protein PKW82_00320 [Spirochaetales bacterium]|nr:hypothetical protein [Spirochaetales bacterium]